MDDGHAISYKLLPTGTPVYTSDGDQLGKVVAVLEAKKEHIFDGIVVETALGDRFVDAPEVARIAERAVTLAIDAEAAAALPEPSKAAPSYKANVRTGRIGRLFGGGWKRH